MRNLDASTLPDLSTARSLVRDLLTDAERAAIHAARWRLMLEARARRVTGGRS